MTIKTILENNKNWSAKVTATDPDFFKKLLVQQTPEYLWIGCSDSRVPANQIAGLLPGEVFVHRNVANVVVHTDLNCLSVVQFAVDVLKVKHIIVCGHYGCGGVRAALEGLKLGLVDNWIRHVKDVRDKYDVLFQKAAQEHHWDLLCEMNVIEQAEHVARTTILQDAWARGQNVSIYGFIYGLADGILHDLSVKISNGNHMHDVVERAMERIRKKHERVA